MCGRYSLITDKHQLGNFFSIVQNEVGSRYNIAPSYGPKNPAYTIHLNDHGQRELFCARWWLIPSCWKKSLKELPASFNARVEDVAAKPFFRGSFCHKRCLVPATGWYEYQGPRGKKDAHYFHMPKHQPFAFAGLWDEWISPEGEVVESFAILTTEANDVARPIHNRMPVIISPDAFDVWLAPNELASDEAKILLRPYNRELHVYKTTGYSANPRHEGRECIQADVSGLATVIT